MLYDPHSTADLILRAADALAGSLRHGTDLTVEQKAAMQRDLREAYRTLKPMEQYHDAMVQQAIAAERVRVAGCRPHLRLVTP